MSTPRERNRERLRTSALFLVIATKSYLQGLRNDETEITELVRLAKEWNKPTIILFHSLGPEDRKELLSYFAGHDVRRTFEAGPDPETTAQEIARAFKD